MTATLWMLVSRRMRVWTPVAALALIALLASPARASKEGVRESTVGIPARITDFVLPGSELDVFSDAHAPPNLFRGRDFIGRGTR